MGTGAVKILQEFTVEAFGTTDGEVWLDLDCLACGTTVRHVESGVVILSLHELITAASEHKKVCAPGPAPDG